MFVRLLWNSFKSGLGNLDMCQFYDIMKNKSNVTLPADEPMNIQSNSVVTITDTLLDKNSIRKLMK